MRSKSCTAFGMGFCFCGILIGRKLLSSKRERKYLYMRLDKYLKVTRLIKRRTVANEACDAGRILVNGVEARASYSVKVGDKITINMGKPLTVKVLTVSEYATKETAADQYVVVEE